MLDLNRPDMNIDVTDPSQAYLFDYLYKLVEQLEMVLDNLTVDNFSPTLAGQFEALTISASNSSTVAAEAQQRANKGITVSDVINSQMFISALETVKSTGENGWVRTVDGTQICYGKVTESTTATFAQIFDSVPAVLTTPSHTVTATTGGFTVESAGTFDYIAIGRKEQT